MAQENPENDYSKEAVLGRLSARRRGSEQRGLIPALILDALVLASSLFSLWVAFSAQTSDEAFPGIAGAVIGGPALFAISRFIRSRPTIFGWLWLLVSGGTLLVVLINSI